MTYHINPNIAKLTPYQPGKDMEEIARTYQLDKVIKLASNENPLGPSPKVVEAWRQLDLNLGRYPDPDASMLKAKLATHHKLQLNQITLANGSDMLFDSVLKVFCDRSSTVLFSEYAFAAYKIACRTLDIPYHEIPAKDYALDLTQCLAAVNSHTRLIFIANPNNPTGTLITHSEFESFMAQLPDRVIVVLDEAYYEYAKAYNAPDGIELLASFNNLILTRTFSKAYGLAGLRLGYALSDPHIADYLNRVRLPFNVSSITQKLAMIALDDETHIETTLQCFNAGLATWQAVCRKLNLDFLPCFGNFITIHLKKTAQPVFESLLKQGIITRTLGPYQMPEHLRITIGTDDENELAIRAFQQIMKEH